MKNDPVSVQLRRDHQEFARRLGEVHEAMDLIETMLPQTWFGRWSLRVFTRLREIWAEEEEELRRAARETYDG